MQSNSAFDFESAYGGYADGLYCFCLRLVGSSQDAEDVVQETFLAAIAGRERFAGRSSESTWLFRIARNRAYKLLRRRKLERLFTLRSEAQTEPSEALALADSVMSLPLKAREAFVLVKVEGLSAAEAGAILGVPEGTVRFRVHLAVKSLRSSWIEGEVATNKGVTNAV
ncbi:MAG TPA: RNA polymerase sigma factor [Fimbriimonas sp.]|nr:RNA polymerase sigma factor [Fimbriimonas sp.]